MEIVNNTDLTPENREKFLEKFDGNERKRIIKNVIILGFAFMMHFTAFHGTSNLQSSVNTEKALGTITLASIYGSLILSNIFLPVIVIKWLGCKWAICLSFLAYAPYIASQFYVRFYLSIFAGLLVGFGGGPLWCAKCTYLSVVAEVFSTITGRRLKKEVLVVRFFGLFFVFYQMAQVFGNLISSAVLSSFVSEENLNNLTTTKIIKNVSEICGANFCPGITTSDDNPNLIPPDQSKINILTGIFLCCMLIACLSIVFGLDSLKRYETGRSGSGSGLSGLRLLAVTLKQLTEKYQLLLLPIIMFIGAEQAFITVDFTSSFVACGWGISKIGYAMICFGIFNALGAFVSGLLTRFCGRIPVMIGVMILHSCLIIWMREWIAVENDYILYCSMAAIWGLSDGIWLVQVNALSGILFPSKEEAAYSNFRLWEATGSVITYACSPYFCTATKLTAILIVMFIGMIGYGIIEFLERQKVNELKKFELVEGEYHEHNKGTN